MEQPKPRRSSRRWAALAFLAVAGSAAGMLVYQRLQGRENPIADLSGFDLAQTPEGPSRVQAGSSAPQAQSGLSLIKTGMPGMRFGAKAAQTPSRQAEGAFTELCRNSEAKMRALNRKYTARYPIIAQYRREWLSYPDLKKLRDDYMEGDHDPVKFLRGLVVSKNLAAMAKKYAAEPAIHAFVKEAVKEAPSGLLSAAMDYLGQDNVVKSLIDNVARSLGLPLGLLGGSGPAPKLDQQAIMDSVMKNNPDLQEAITPEVQKTLSAPEARKKPQGQSQ